MTAAAWSEHDASSQLFLQADEMVHTEEETAMTSLADSMTVYKREDFEGLFTYLETNCNGPGLMACQLDDKLTTSADAYLLEVDDCLYANSCLSYHQILTYNQKLNEVKKLIKTTDVKYRPTTATLAVPQVSDSTNDLELAEVNYLCIVAAVDETSKSARQNTFNYCLEHLNELFEAGQYSQAINTNFLTQTHPYTWQMIAIFGGIFAILGLSLFLMCRFMKNKDKDAKRAKHSSRNGSRTRD